MEKKIEDYLHLYLGCECLMDGVHHVFLTGYQNKKPLITLMLKNKKPSFKTEDTARVIDEWLLQPILRPLESMTEGEYQIMRDRFSVDVVSSVDSQYLKWADKPRHVLVLENRLTTNTLTFNDGMLLLRAGYDLFGLIESGLAISSPTKQ